jgi:uncharacterized membrane protein YtjA (UPF0391 family)
MCGSTGQASETVDPSAWSLPIGDATVQLLRVKEGMPMLSMALTFLIVGLIAGLLGLYGVAAVATQIAWVLFLVGVVLLVIHMVGSRRLPPAL